jgi:hypothetical protein
MHFTRIYFIFFLFISEIEKNGIFNAETFSYLVGDIGRYCRRQCLLKVGEAGGGGGGKAKNCLPNGKNAAANVDSVFNFITLTN